VLNKRFDQNALQNNNVHYLNVHKHYKVVLDVRILEQPYTLRDQDKQNGAKEMDLVVRFCCLGFIGFLDYRKSKRPVLPQRVYGRPTLIYLKHNTCIRNNTFGLI
jgi:hypothetical protein